MYKILIFTLIMCLSLSSAAGAFEEVNAEPELIIGETVSVDENILYLENLAYSYKDKYFVDFEGTKISIGMFMAMAFMGFSIWAISKKKLENTMISLIIKLAIWAFIVTMIENILHDLALILWMTVIGLVGAQCFEWGAEKAGKEQKKKLDAIAKAKEKHDIEQAEHEIDR